MEKGRVCRKRAGSGLQVVIKTRGCQPRERRGRRPVKESMSGGSWGGQSQDEGSSKDRRRRANPPLHSSRATEQAGADAQ